MKKKNVLALLMTVVMAGSLTACGSSTTADTSSSTDTSAADTAEEADDAEEAEEADDTADAADDGELSYTSIVLGETGTDVTATVRLKTHRTDMVPDDYAGTSWSEYLAEFNKMYPNITVDVEAYTDYAEQSLLTLQGNSDDWDIMMIPAVDAADYGAYFVSFGSLTDVEKEVRFASSHMYDGEVYGIPSTGNAQGIVYNKAVFEEAGITELPTTPEEFIADLQLIKDNTDAIPLYTNYAAGWTMGAWDAYISGTATGDGTYENQVLLHTANPFSDPGDGTHAYNVYKILYDAVAADLIEDDYTTTDWEGCKGMINNGEIGCMVLGSWAYSQMRDAGDHGEDIGYMSFPITVDGKQYATAGADYNFGINNKVDENQQLASMIFIKWMTNESGFSYNEGGIPINVADDNYPELYAAFDGIDFIANEPALEGEEDLFNDLNSDSNLMIDAGGNDKVQQIVEHAANGDKTFDEIMDDWNAAWTDAQESNGVEVN